MDFACHVGVQLDVQIILPVGADGVAQLNLALVHADAVILFQPLGNLLGGDGAVETPVGAAAGMDLDQQGLQPGGGCLRLGGFGFDLVPECLLLALDGVELLSASTASLRGMR